MPIVYNPDSQAFEDDSGAEFEQFNYRLSQQQQMLEDYWSVYSQNQLNAIFDGRFVVSIFKKLATSAGARPWVNTYELVGAAGTTLAAVVPVIAALVQFERLIHLTSVTFDRYVVSTWAPDGNPYDPNTFTGTPIQQSGLRNGGGVQLEPLKVVAKFKRAAAVGKNGRIFYRGCLTEDDVQSYGGEPGGDTASSSFQSFISAISAAQPYIAPYLSAGANAIKLALIGANGVSRKVTAVGLDGFTVVSNNHRYYDHQQGTGGGGSF